MLSESFVLLSRLESKDKFAQLVARARARISINDINGHLYNEKNMGKIPRTNSALHTSMDGSIILKVFLLH